MLSAVCIGIFQASVLMEEMLLDIGINGFSLVDLVEGHGEIWVIDLLLKMRVYEKSGLNTVDCDEDMVFCGFDDSFKWSQTDYYSRHMAQTATRLYNSDLE